ncbi:MAG TPA: hypothetical protein VGF59_07830 [Bryobacteraceae bacterium]|jgi:hypothetical protein
MRAGLLSLMVSIAWAQSGTDPKPSPADYPVHTTVGNVGIGAEYMVRSISGSGEMYIAETFLVVEVALYPPKGGSIRPNIGKFSLSLNRKEKNLLKPQPASMVAARLQHPEWKEGPTPQLDIGVMGADVRLGGPPRNDHPFPGAPPVERPLPRVPTPEPQDRSGVERTPKITASELAIQMALPEDEHRGPISGYIYFPYIGKISAIKSVELLYEDAVLKLK